MCERFWEWLKKWWKGLQEWEPNPEASWVKAVKRTKLEGLKDSIKPKISFLERLFWLSSFLCFAVQSTLLTIESVNQAYKHPMEYGLHEPILLEDTFFPGFTICKNDMLSLKPMNALLERFDDLKADGYVMIDGGKWSKEDYWKFAYIADWLCDTSESTMSSNKAVHHYSKDLKDIAAKVPNSTSILDDPTDEFLIEKTIPLLQKGLMDCSNTIAYCEWNGEPGKCEKLFVRSHTDIGSCCSFNKMPDEVLKKYQNDTQSIHSMIHEYGDLDRGEVESWKAFKIDTHPFVRTGATSIKFQHRIDQAQLEINETESDKSDEEFPRRQTLPGSQQGLTVILKHDPVDEIDIPSCPAYDGTGFVAGAHSPFEVPQMRSIGSFLSPNKEVIMKIDLTVHVPEEGLKDMPKEVRQCYFQDERALDHFHTYTEENCKVECVTKLIEAKCKCLPLEMSKGDGNRICTRANIRCIEDFKKELNKYGFGDMCQKAKCYKPCTEVEYKTTTSDSTYANYDPEMLSGLDIEANETITIFHAYINSVTSKSRKLRSGRADLIGNIGGIWGLYLGLSITRTMNIITALGIMLYPTLKSIYFFGSIAQSIRDYIRRKRDQVDGTEGQGNLIIVMPASVDVDAEELEEENEDTNNRVVDLRQRRSHVVAVPMSATTGSLFAKRGVENGEIERPSSANPSVVDCGLPLDDDDRVIYIPRRHHHGMQTRSQSGRSHRMMQSDGTEVQVVEYFRV